MRRERFDQAVGGVVVGDDVDVQAGTLRGARGDRPDAGDRLAAHRAERRVAERAHETAHAAGARERDDPGPRDVVFEPGRHGIRRLVRGHDVDRPPVLCKRRRQHVARFLRAEQQHALAFEGTLEEAGGDVFADVGRGHEIDPHAVRRERFRSLGPIAATCVSPSARKSRRARAIRWKNASTPLRLVNTTHAYSRRERPRRRRRPDRRAARSRSSARGSAPRHAPTVGGECVRLRGGARDQHGLAEQRSAVEPADLVAQRDDVADDHDRGRRQLRARLRRRACRGSRPASVGPASSLRARPRPACRRGGRTCATPRRCSRDCPSPSAGSASGAGVQAIIASLLGSVRVLYFVIDYLFSKK